MSDAGKPLAQILAERGASYGPFIDEAKIAQSLKLVMRHQLTDDCVNSFVRQGWLRLEADQTSALELIATKIARVLNGDPNHVDSWRDIAGYAQLIVNRLEATAPAKRAAPKKKKPKKPIGIKSKPALPSALTEAARDD